MTSRSHPLKVDPLTLSNSVRICSYRSLENDFCLEISRKIAESSLALTFRVDSWCRNMKNNIPTKNSKKHADDGWLPYRIVSIARDTLQYTDTVPGNGHNTIRSA